MRNVSMDQSPVNKWLVFSAVSLAFFFLNLSTFTSLGVVLYTMVTELHWTMTAAGFSFSVLGLACGLSSPLPAVCLKWFGGRTTLVFGCVLLLVGFVIASVSHSIAMFYLSMLLLGIGFSLAGNMPGVYLLAEWFEIGTARIIGYYLMFGALGAACGPLIVEAIVSGNGSWRGHWRWMAVAAGVIAVYCLAFVRDVQRNTHATAGHSTAEEHSNLSDEQALGVVRDDKAAARWTSRAAIFTWQFFLAAASMTLTMTTVTTYSSVVVTHLVNLGATPAAGALTLSVIAIAATVVKGGAGRLCELIPSAYILAAGLVCQAIGSFLLAYAGSGLLQFASAITFGMGWGLAYVAGTVVLLDFFGGTTGAKILSIVWLVSTAAAAGPLAAGMIADRVGSFVPIFLVLAAFLLVLAVPVFFMRAPVRRTAAALQLSPMAARQQA
jgi:MFS family permease